MLALRDGSASVLVAPEHGGAIVEWLDGTVPVLRRPSPDALRSGDVGGMACFPLLPYCNRIAFGRFGWAGHSHSLGLDLGAPPHAIHGLGWQRPWTVLRADAASADLELSHTATADDSHVWPFAFEATLGFRLSGGRLMVDLTATNRHDAAAPMGLGLHPYFPRLPGQSLRFNAGGVWVNDATMLPVRHTAIPPEWDHADGQAIGTARLDNCFTGWDGAASLSAPGWRVSIEASGIFRSFQVFTPAGADFCCAEPVSHVPDAINRPGLPTGQSMHVLAPGESLHGSVTLAFSGSS